MQVTLPVCHRGKPCRSPYPSLRASYCKEGEVYQIGGWEVSYNPRQRAYVVHRAVYPYGQYDYFQFNNFSCALAKLAQLSKQEAAS